MKRYFKKFLAVFLCVALAVTVLPVAASAKTVAVTPVTDVQTETNTETTTENAEQEAYVLGELVDKREPNVKHFRLSNGNIEAAVYPEDVHYTDSDGLFQDINNSMVSGNVDGIDVFQNKENDISVKFAKKSNKNKLFSITQDGHKIKVHIEEADKSEAEAIALEETAENESGNPYKLHNLSGGVVYRDIFENIDIEYIFVSRKLKENIILKDEVDITELTYVYKLPAGFEAVAEDEKTIIIRNAETKETLTVLSAPALWDSEGNYSEALTLTITEVKNNEVKIKLSWAEADLSDAVYPVTIDPMMQAATQYTQIQDTYVSSSSPTTNYSSSDMLTIGRSDYALIKLPTPSLAPSERVVKAELQIAPYCYCRPTAPFSNQNEHVPPVNITVHKINNEWNETTVNYNSITADFYNAEVEDYYEVLNDDEIYIWDITRLLNSWIEGESTNNGMLLKTDKEPATATTFKAYLAAKEVLSTGSEFLPNVSYQYISVSGIEDYYSYHSQNAGFAGTVYINDLTGNVTIVNQIYSTGGELMPINVSLVYNNDKAFYGNPSPYGVGWKLNWSQKIVQVEIGAKTYLKYTDADGTDHYFEMDDATGVWEEEIDHDRKVYSETTGDYRMTNSSDGNMYFKKNGDQNQWYLYKSEDAWGNNIIVNLNSTNPEKVESITSSTGNLVEFQYGSNGLLQYVNYYDQAFMKCIILEYNLDTVIAHDSLSRITYFDDTTVQYHYMETGAILTKVVDIDGKYLTYGYEKSRNNRVSTVREYASATEAGSGISYDYTNGATKIKDIQTGREYLYSFAAVGTPKSVVEITENGANCGYGKFFEFNGDKTETSEGKDRLTFESKGDKSAVNLLSNHSFEDTEELPVFVDEGRTVGTGTGAVSSEVAFIGGKSYKISRSADNNSSKTMAYYEKNVVTTNTYTFSAYVKTDAMNAATGGVQLQVIGTTQAYSSELITAAHSEWQRLSVTFKPSADELVKFAVVMQGANGHIYFDCIQLEIGELSEYNILENAGFEKDEEAYNTIGWKNTIESNFTTVGPFANERSGKLLGSSTSTPRFHQIISVPNGAKDDTYVASAFARAVAIPKDGQNNFSIMVEFWKGSEKVNQVNIKFNTYTVDWQKAAGAARAEGEYDRIEFYLRYYHNANAACFDNAALYKDIFGTAYTYDDEGNIISTTDLEGKDEYKFDYNSNNKLISETNISGGKITYSYNAENEQQLDYAAAAGITTQFKYSATGNVESITTVSSNMATGRYFYIIDRKSGKALTVEGSYSEEGTQVIFEERTNATGQQWKFVEAGNGAYYLVPKCADYMYLSLDGNMIAPSTIVDILMPYSSEFQTFCYEAGNDGTFRLTAEADPTHALGNNGGASMLNEETAATELVLIAADNSHSADNKAIISSATYTSNNRNTASVTDSRGNTTNYSYHSTLNHLEAVTDAKNQVTSYQYDGYSELLKKVTNGSSSVNYTYDSGKRLSTITSPSGTVYTLTYDSFGRSDTVKVGTRVLSDNEYNAKGELIKVTYGNGNIHNYTYDELGRITQFSYGANGYYRYLYDSASKPLEVFDSARNTKTVWSYDILGRAVREGILNATTNTALAELLVIYDDTKNRVSGNTVRIGDISNNTEYVYGNQTTPDIITGVKLNDEQIISYSYDYLDRQLARTLATGVPFVTEYTYEAGRQKGSSTDDPTLTTTLIKTVKNGNDTLTYTYDVLGNITSIAKNGTVQESYTYDNLNQLKTVTRGSDTWEYTYDNGGNILSVKKNGTVIKNYGYTDATWKDLLTSYNGYTITYDAIGNPIDYRDGFWFDWNSQRMLTSFCYADQACDFTYDQNGLRVSKYNYSTDETTDYYWLNGVLQAQKTGSEYIVFLRDESGNAYGFLLKNGTTEQYYYYIFNAQGDVIGILDNQGTVVVEYTYSAWGEILSITGSLASTIGQKNPLRYRGYYYDNESGFYYLQSRYYDPVTGRFLNADSFVSTGQGMLSYNMFAYCGNNPVMYCDPSGKIGIWTILGIGVCVALVLSLAGCNDASTTSNSSGSAELPPDPIEPEPSEPEPSEPQPNPPTITDNLNLYDASTGSWQEGKINVQFFPNNDNGDNPSFQIKNSYLITNEDDQRLILEYIMQSEFYSQTTYQRSIGSMLIEWEAHNHIYAVTKHQRVAHTDFDKNDENTTYLEYWGRAILEGIYEIF